MNIRAVIGEWSSRVAVLQFANFRRYFLGQSLSMFGDMLVPLALAFAVLNLTGSVAMLGIVILSSRLPMVLFTLLGGAVGDHLPRRSVMLTADVVRMIAHTVTGTLLLTGQGRLWHLIVLQLIAGSAAAFFDPAASGLIRNIVETTAIRQANSLVMISRNGIAIMSLAASGAIVALVGPGWAFVCNGISFAASVYFLLRLELPADARSFSQPNILAQVRGGLVYVRRSSWLFVTIPYTALLNAIVIAPMMVLGPVVCKTTLGGAAAWAAILIATTSGSIVGSILSLRTMPRRPLSAALGVILCAIPLTVCFAVGAPLWISMLAAIAFGAQSSFSNVLIMSLIQRDVPNDTISRVTSLEQLGARVLTPVGLALVAGAASRWGTSAILWGSACWIAISTLCVLLLPAIRRADVELSEPSPNTVAA